MVKKSSDGKSFESECEKDAGKKTIAMKTAKFPCSVCRKNEKRNPI